MKKINYEVLTVAVVTGVFAVAGWYSIFDRFELVEGIYKTNDPGAGLLPLILLSILSISSITFLTKIKTEEKRSLKEVFHSAHFPLLLSILLVIVVFLTKFLGYLLTINGLTIIWFILYGKLRNENKNKLLLNTVFMILIVNCVVYLFFIKLLNTPLP